MILPGQMAKYKYTIYQSIKEEVNAWISQHGSKEVVSAFLSTKINAVYRNFPNLKKKTYRKKQKLHNNGR